MFAEINSVIFFVPIRLKRDFMSLAETVESWPPGCDKGTRENEKDGGTFVEELETPVVDANLKEDKQSGVAVKKSCC